MAYLATGDANERINASAVPLTSLNNFTFMCWAYIDTTSEKGRFILIGSDQNGPGVGYGYGIGVGLNNDSSIGNEFYAAFEGVGGMDSNTNIGTGWHHLCLVDRAGQQFMYLDGNVVAGFDLANPVAPADNTIVGDVVATSPNSVQNLTADLRVANLKVWSSALGTAQIQTEMSSFFPIFNWNSLSMFWPLEKSGGAGTTNAIDFTQKFTTIGQAQNTPSYADNPPIARC